MGSKFTGGISRRRDEMYGNTKFDRLKHMKNSLTTDHISMLQKEGRKVSLPPWESTTKTTYIGRQPVTGVSVDTAFQKERQRASHFTMRADGSNIEDVIYKSSTAMNDYNKKNTDVVSYTHLSCSRNEVFSENNTDNSPSTVEISYKRREAVCSTLKQLFLQYDITKNGYVSKEALKRACNCLLEPIPEIELDEILKVTKRGMAGTVDYNHFIQQYMSNGESRHEPETLKAAQRSEENVNFDDIPGLEAKEEAETASWPPKTTAGNPLLITSELGKNYQTTAHFKFGNDGENPASVYQKDYDMKGHLATDKPVHVKPPVSSEVMHKSADSEFGKSTKQMDFTKLNMIKDQKTFVVPETLANKNKLRHSKNSVVLTCDEQRNAEDRQASIARSSFIKYENMTTQAPCTAERPKYRYLDTEAALPYMGNTPSKSEAKEAFSNLTSPGEVLAKLAQVKKENKTRVNEQKKVHFKFGSEEPSKVTEAQDEYMQCRAVGDEVPSAGKKNMHDPRFNHIAASKNTQDLKKNPMSLNSFDTLRMNKKGYFSGQSTPGNPLHLSLHRVFSKLDPDSTGKVTKEQMKEVCGNKINISHNAMEALLRKCDRYEDGNINYHTFLNNLTEQQIPEGISTAHTGSTMSNDYRPLQQRSFTEAQVRTIEHMNRKPILPQPSHLFHMDENRGNNFMSTMNQDFIQPVIQPRTWIPSDAC
ncbi:uncharacterized protein LOC117116020 [Anneissia japonica]|uniref:uncharacterized protein LOC117116020 n=1 Tax=Anneissia japonica TaxID=1529436 RepID=UPI0014255C63|nr:uncharacterized protein LOC117116020 [Anneissia japonica]